MFGELIGPRVNSHYYFVSDIASHYSLKMHLSPQTRSTALGLHQRSFFAEWMIVIKKLKAGQSEENTLEG